LKLSCSVRTRDRNFTSFCQFVTDAILVGVESLLILTILNDKKYNKSIQLNLSVPSKIFYHNRSLFEKKIEAKPYSLVTQLISSLSDLGEIVDIAKSFKIKVVACVMVPSYKNRRSADIVGLDWKEYEKNPVDFIKAASTLADEVLISSPNSFRIGIDLLKSLRQ